MEWVLVTVGVLGEGLGREALGGVGSLCSGPRMYSPQLLIQCLSATHLQSLNITAPQHVRPRPRPAPSDNHIIRNPDTPCPQAGAVFAGIDGVVEEEDGRDVLH